MLYIGNFESKRVSVQLRYVIITSLILIILIKLYTHDYIAQKFLGIAYILFFLQPSCSKHIDIPGRTHNDTIERHHDFIYHLSELVSDK